VKVLQEFVEESVQNPRHEVHLKHCALRPLHFTHLHPPLPFRFLMHPPPHISQLLTHLESVPTFLEGHVLVCNFAQFLYEIKGADALHEHLPGRIPVHITPFALDE